LQPRHEVAGLYGAELVLLNPKQWLLNICCAYLMKLKDAV
jgi:hypothetical protein